MAYDGYKALAAMQEAKAPKPAKPRKPIKQRSAKGVKVSARDQRVRARLVEIYEERCFFGVRGWPDCATWTPDDQPHFQHMHIFGKHTDKGGSKFVRNDIGFSIIGCWMHHQEHTLGRLKITAESNGMGEVYRTFEMGDLYLDDLAPSEIIE
jgi:hypothetical protein